MLLGLTNGDPEKLKLISLGYKLGRGEGIKEEEPEKIPPVKLDPLAMEALRRSEFSLKEQVMPPASSTSQASSTSTKRQPNRGIRATILRLLSTGPTDYDNLRRSANIADKPLKTSLCQLHDADMITISKDGLYSLTARGWPEANFFRSNPALKIRPSRPKKV